MYTSRASEFPPVVSSPSSSPANDRLDGYLVKRGQRVKSWKRRFFSFRDGMLTYRKSHREGAKVLGRDEVTNVFYWGGVKHGFCVHLGSGRELFLSAASEDEAAVWYNAVGAFVWRQQRNKDFMRLMCKRHLDPIVESTWEC
ncbi:hypothetical protein PybrP1_004971 [[Pythium] brassicae (nom. inval.)]|nr:hypothetical protein PybrP1_004971 [[Pythium] brassicae (nom. inval.)]